MKNKKRIIFVITFLIIYAIYLFVSIRGEYLQTLDIGEKYIGVFNQNIKYKISIVLVNFAFLYIVTYITTIFVKKGLKKFFEEEKKEMPKLPRKSIALVVGIIGSMLTSNMILERAMLALNSSVFGINDPIFNMDIAYYVFQKPFFELLILYGIGVIVALSIYTVAYYIIVFNKFFDKGIDVELLKKSTLIKQLMWNIIIIAIGISGITLFKTQDIVTEKFLTLTDGTSLVGAGLMDVTIKVWGYRIFAVVILICAIIATRNLEKGKFKKLAVSLVTIPAYLVVMFVILIGTDIIFVGKNELDKEKKYIQYNIEYTKNAYNINIEEKEIENSGTVTATDIEENQDVVKNVNLLKEEIVLTTLKEYQTNLGYYAFGTTKPAMYKINNQDTLVYISPREIISNDTRTYNNKTYEYTHGFGVIINNATKMKDTGILEYIQKNFDGKDQKIKIIEPRIYFGLQTNQTIVTNTKNKVEYDYPLTATTNSENTYEGEAGLKLNIIDRLILGIKEKDLRFAFSSNVTKDSKIITKRNIIQRAKTVMPYIEYDQEPYTVITDEGRIVWILDGYTMTNNYPYSQESIVELSNGYKKKINYIRNSIKVIIDSYDGTMKFYITDRTDPIGMAYRNIYPGLFEDLDKQIPEDIAKHIIYPKYLYNVQAAVLERYHDVGPEVLYRADDVWDKAKESTKKVTSVTGTDIEPYYTAIKNDNGKTELGLIVPYTVVNKQNLTSYLVGTYDSESKLKLKLYKFATGNAILGTIQLDSLIEQDETIAQELKLLNTTGTKIEKNIIVVPVNNTLLYIEPIYQVMLNESQVPILKKVVVASGNKVAIGNNLEQAISNLLSTEAVSIEVDTENIDELIQQIINANKNLQQSNASNNWDMIGRDIGKLQELIRQLETLENEKAEKASKKKNNTVNNTITNDVVNTNNINVVNNII